MHNLVENDDEQMVWLQTGLDLLDQEDQEGNEVSLQEGSTLVPAASTSNTRAVHLSPGMVVKKEDQVRGL